MAHHLSKVLSVNDTHNVRIFSDKSLDNVENGLLSSGHLDCDVIVIGGGGIVNTDFWAFKNDGLTKLKNSQKPIAFVNVNITQDILKDSQLIEDLKSLKARWWVRNRQSVDTLTEIGISASLVPDVSFRPGVVAPYNKMGGKKQLSVFLNSYVFNDLIHNDNVNQFVQALHNCRLIAQFCDWMTTFGWNITFFSAHTAKYVDDRIPSAFVFGTMENKDSAKWVAESLAWDDLIREITHSDLVLSMRFHSTTTALAAGVPCIDITHHEKNKSLLDEMGALCISAEYSSLTHDALIRAAQCAENPTSHESKVKAYRSEAVTRWELFDREWSTYLNNIEGLQ